MLFCVCTAGEAGHGGGTIWEQRDWEHTLLSRAIVFWNSSTDKVLELGQNISDNLFVAYCGTRVKIMASSVQCCLIMWRKSRGTFRIRNSTMVLRQRGNVDVWVWTDTQQTGGNKQTEKTNRVTKYKKQLLFPIWWLDDFLQAAHIFVIYGASESQDAEVLLLLPHRQQSEARIPDLGFSEVSVVLP